jgi:sugar (pentulose or hexulose) kinase
MEGIILRIDAILDLIKSTCKNSSGPSNMDNACIIASGNALEHNETWRKMLADCSGSLVLLDHDTSEGTSRGVAIMIAEALNSKTDVLPMEKLAHCIETRNLSEASDHWSKKKMKQNEIITAMSSTW